MEGIHVAIAADRLGTFAGIPITNTLLMTWVAMGVIFVITFMLHKGLRVVPGRSQMLAEALLGGVLEFTTETLEDRKRAMMVFPILMTLFLFILFGNWLEFVPGVESIRYFGDTSSHGDSHSVGAPLLRAMNSDLNTTIALAVIAFLTIEVVGVVSVGAIRYAKKFFNFTSPVNLFVGMLELMSEMIRLVSFSFRLFGNIFAGGVLIVIVTYFVPYLVPAPFILFEMFVGLVQAAVFALLTLFFIKLATMEMDHASH